MEVNVKRLKCYMDLLKLSNFIWKE